MDSVQKLLIIFYTIIISINNNKCFSATIPIIPPVVANSGGPISPGILQSGYPSNGLLIPGIAPGLVGNRNLIMPGIDSFNFMPIIPEGNFIRPPLPIVKPVVEKAIAYGGEEKVGNNHEYGNKNQEEKIKKYENAIESKGHAGGGAVQEYQAEHVGKKDKNSNVGFHNAINNAHQKSADEKAYDGQKKINKEGKSEEFTKARKSYRKGHNKKGSKSFHSKDASEKVETFYDEKHDQAGNINNNNIYGSYGDKQGASYFSGFKDDHLNKQNGGKKGSFEKVSIKDNNIGGGKQFGQHGFNNQNQEYAINGGLGLNAAKGLAQNNGIHMNFAKSIPFFY